MITFASVAFLLTFPVADETAAVRAVLDAQVACWNKGDLDGFLNTYWNSEELTFYSGNTITKGWKPVAERYRTRPTERKWAS
jgi:hypothetical protein